MSAMTLNHGHQAQSTTGWTTASRFGVDVMTAGVAAAAVTPAVCLVDSAIMIKAASACSLRDCFKTLVYPVSKIPKCLLLSKPASLIFCVYFGTFATANTIDTATSVRESRSADTTSTGLSKFIGVAAVSTALTVFKDSRLVQMFGGRTTKAVVPTATYALFTLRDAVTIYSCFNLPPILAERLKSLPDPVKTKLGALVSSDIARINTAQLMLPAAIQFVTTPLHLLGLDMYNRREKIAHADRFDRVRRDFGPAVMARIARIVPAFGIGGVINTRLRSTCMKRL